MNNKNEHVLLQGDILSKALSFLDWKEVIHLRRVASSWKQAATETPVEEAILVQTQESLQGLGDCLPQLQSLKLDQNSELDDDDQLLLHRFSNLAHFQCLHTTPSLLQSYRLPSLLEGWNHLESLNLHGNEDLEWNLADLAPLQQLKDLRCINNRCLQGDTTRDLLTSRLFSTLTILDISGCTRVTGRLKDFGKLPKLQWLGINRTQVAGDLRHDIRWGEFGALQEMGLCSQAVYGASQIDSVQDAAAVMTARLQIIKQSTWEDPLFPLGVHLSPDAPEYHERVEQRLYTSERDPPFSIEVVVVGNRRWGWRWSNYLGGFCDAHWVDPEPIDCGEDYQKEWAEFQSEQSLFSGFLDPPTPEEYRVLCQERCL